MCKSLTALTRSVPLSPWSHGAWSLPVSVVRLDVLAPHRGQEAGGIGWSGVGGVGVAVKGGDQGKWERRG